MLSLLLKFIILIILNLNYLGSFKIVLTFNLGLNLSERDQMRIYIF